MNLLAVNSISALMRQYYRDCIRGMGSVAVVFLFTIVVDYVTVFTGFDQGRLRIEKRRRLLGLDPEGTYAGGHCFGPSDGRASNGGTDVLETGAIYFYLANELISITENYGRLGLPMPDKLRRMIAVLKNKDSDKEQDPPKR